MAHYPASLGQDYERLFTRHTPLSPRNTQYIRTHCDVSPLFWSEVSQRFQITRINIDIEINWHETLQCVFVYIRNSHLSYLLTNPNKQLLTLRDVLYDFEYEHDQIVLDYCESEWNLDNILDTSIRNVPICKITLYPHGSAVYPAQNQLLNPQ
jgi:hypothetical protein